MSRRYGRKQKRAARETIEALGALVNSEQRNRLYADVNRRKAEEKAEFLLDRIRLWDGEIRSLLGPYTSFAINEPTYRVDHPDQIRQMPVMPPTPIGFLGADVPMAMESIAYHIETMFGFMCRLDDRDLERLRRLLTLRVMVGGDRYGDAAYYAVSEQTWRAFQREGPNSPGLERFIHRIAGDLVRLLVAPPKKKPSGDDLVPAMERDAQRRDAERLRR